MEKYTGVIIEESLENKDVLKEINIVETEIEPVEESHKTPWISQWTMHTVEIEPNNADEMAEIISQALDSKHDWYADFKNDEYHYIIYYKKIFKVDLKNPVKYQEAKNYGISLGIPDYQVDFC